LELKIGKRRWFGADILPVPRLRLSEEYAYPLPDAPLPVEYNLYLPLIYGDPE
jgi:hypothetical protein